ncbi:hypothetical protein [Paraburkholderia diazotrophica]|uniref:hypothetical protein n=1 Tax=Paraburkholderia diazotrophica TaxID=667676 RepID=UPI00317C9793
MANKILAVKLTGRSCGIRLGDARKSADRPLQDFECLRRKRLTDAVRSRDKLKECGRCPWPYYHLAGNKYLNVRKAANVTDSISTKDSESVFNAVS